MNNSIYFSCRFLTCFIFFSLLSLISSCKTDLNYNIIQGQKIIASSEYANGKAASLVDSNLAENLWSTGSFGEHWLQIDFDREYDFDTISFSLSAMPESNCSINLLDQKNRKGEYENFYSKIMRVGNGSNVIIVNKRKDVSSLKIVLSNDSSWMTLVNLDVRGK